MDKVQEVGSLSEQTVQKVARGEHEVPRKKRKRGPSKAKATPVREVRVVPEVMKKAKSLNRDARCIQIISPTEVIVWNHPRQWLR